MNTRREYTTVAVLATVLAVSAPGQVAFHLDWAVAREGTAYLANRMNVQEYGAHEPITRAVASCSVSDGQYERGQGVGGVDVVVQCRNARYTFGIGRDGRFYRTSDAQQWERLGAGYEFLAAMADDSLLGATRTAAYRLAFHRSTDDGQTWAPARWVDTGAEFQWLTPAAWLTDFGWHEAANGTVVMVEYKLSAGGRHIYRSGDRGATWQVVHDGGGLTFHHYHAVTKHEQLQRWVAVTGDELPYQVVFVSDDDGRSWYPYTRPGQVYLQPTYLLDFGHPTRLLIGSDLSWQVGRFDVSDGPSARQIASVVTNWDQKLYRNHCFYMHAHDGVYYACSTDLAEFPPRAAVISVSRDREHWAIYHRFTQDEAGIWRCAGRMGGKLRYAVRTGNELRTFAIAPAQVTTQAGVVLLPPTANLLATPAHSSAGSIEGWLNGSQEVPPGSGQRGVLECVVGAAHQGETCLRYQRRDGGFMALASPAFAAAVGRTYQARLWLRGKAALVSARWYRNYADLGEVHAIGLAEDEWTEILTAPFTVPPDTHDLRIFIVAYSTLANDCVVYLDSLQVESVPATPWQLGGSPRAGCRARARALCAGAWTNVFSVEPEVMSEHLAAAEPLLIRTYQHGGGTFLRLTFDPQDMRFVLHARVDGFEHPPLRSGRQHFQRRAQIRFGVRYSPTRLCLAVANGQPTEIVSRDVVGSPQAGTLTLEYDSVANPHTLPLTQFNDQMVSAAVSDERLHGLMNDYAGGQARARGDMNLDGICNVFDIDGFVLALVDPSAYFACYPDGDLNLADCNADGAVNTADIDPFIAIVTGG